MGFCGASGEEERVFCYGLGFLDVGLAVPLLWLGVGWGLVWGDLFTLEYIVSLSITAIARPGMPKWSRTQSTFSLNTSSNGVRDCFSGLRGSCCVARLSARRPENTNCESILLV